MLIKRRELLGTAAGLAVTPLFCNSLAAEEVRNLGKEISTYLNRKTAEKKSA